MGIHRSSVMLAMLATAVFAAAVAIGPASVRAAESGDAGPGRVLEAIGEGVRSLFNRLFGEPRSAPPPAEPTPATAPAKPAPAAAITPPPASVSASAPPQLSGLHQAIARGDLAGALALIEKGADLEARDGEAGATPLHYAVMRGSLPVIELLISRGADVNSRTRTATTPLHTAVVYSRLAAAQFLIDNGADVNAASATGATPLALAEAARNEPLRDLLKRHGAR